MAFDRETLKPKAYRLEIGRAGELRFLYCQRVSVCLRICSRKPASSRLHMGRTAVRISWTPSGCCSLNAVCAGHTRKSIRIIQTGGRRIPGWETVLWFIPTKDEELSCRTANKGRALRVQLQDKKIWINHKKDKTSRPSIRTVSESYDFHYLRKAWRRGKQKTPDGQRKYCEGMENYTIHRFRGLWYTMST